MTTPRTAAGLDAAWIDLLLYITASDGPIFDQDVRDGIKMYRPRIEAEARAAALDEARAAVNDCASFANYPETGDLIMRRHALAAIDALRERDGE